MNGGFLVIDRARFDALVEGFQKRLKPAARSTWFYLLYNANYVDDEDLKRGQIEVSIRSLSKETGVSERTTRTILDHLLGRKKSDTPSDTRLTHQVTQQGLLLTIENYDSWVRSKTQSDTPTDTRPTHQVTHPIYEETNINKKTNKTLMSADAKIESKIECLFERHKALINPRVQLTSTAQKKIQTRLKTLSLETLKEAQNCFSKNKWRMDNNRTQPLSWFFRSDEQIETFRLLEADLDSVDEVSSGENVAAYQKADISKYSGRTQDGKPNITARP